MRPKISILERRHQLQTGGFAMTRLASPARDFGIRYWQARAADTEREISRVRGAELRAIYVDLLGHHLRMAELYNPKPRS